MHLVCSAIGEKAGYNHLGDAFRKVWDTSTVSQEIADVQKQVLTSRLCRCTVLVLAPTRPSALA